MAALTSLTAWIEIECLCLEQAHPLKNITLMHSLLGFVISMLLVFRTNTAYERWWEAHKIWAGLVSNCHSLALKLRATTPPENEELAGWWSCQIGGYLHQVRSELAGQSGSSSSPLLLLQAMHQKLEQMCRQGQLPEARLFMLSQELTCLGAAWMGSQRIRNTPIPQFYLLFLRKFMLAYTLTLPLGFAFSLSWYAVPVVVFVFYVLASLELIAEQIEQPFGNDSADLALERICQRVEDDLRSIFSNRPQTEALEQEHLELQASPVFKAVR